LELWLPQIAMFCTWLEVVLLGMIARHEQDYVIRQSAHDNPHRGIAAAPVAE
jgi:hypothetical protein